MKKNKNHDIELKRFNPTVEQGLNNDDVSYMQSAGKVNIAKNPTNKSYITVLLVGKPLQN